MSSSYTVQVRSVGKVFAAASEAGVAPEELCQRVGLTYATLEDPDNRILEEQLVALYENAALLTGDDAFGLHVGERVDLTTFDVLGYVILNSSTLGDAFNRLIRYYAIWSDGSSFALTREGANTRLSYSYIERRARPCRHESEATLAIVLSASRRVTNVEWRPHAVGFQHEAPRDVSEHRRIFGTDVLFERAANELIFKTDLLDLPVVTADASLRAVLDRQAEQSLANSPGPGRTTDLVRALLTKALRGGDPSLEALAFQMGMSARTLQRRLRSEGSLHRELLEETRRTLATGYLRQPEVAICEVAYLLGFSEPSAFHRAFRRWTGMTPKEYRRGRHPRTR